MAEKGLRSPVVRKLFTIALFAGIAGIFLAIYFLVYLPHQQADFNQRIFRILHESAHNFSTRVENYGTVYTTSYLVRNNVDDSIEYADLSLTDFNDTFANSFKGIPKDLKKVSSFQIFKHDTVSYEIRNEDSVGSVSRGEKLLSEILEPIVSIHSNTFEGILLIEQKKFSDTSKGKSPTGARSDAILYKSPIFDIAKISSDSLFDSKIFQASALKSINLSGLKYKMFLVPFNIKGVEETFVLSGLISEGQYNAESQHIPVDFLVAVIFILVFLLLCLPFIKVFVLSVQENITIADVRFIIAAIYIIPFIVILVFSSRWIYIYPDRFSDSVLSSLQTNVKYNFYREIKQMIEQEKKYDSIITNPNNSAVVKLLRDSLKGTSTLPPKNNSDYSDLKNFIFYPEAYKNLENVHWMDGEGNDIASWRFTKDTATYFNLRERAYFRDIRYNRAQILPQIDTAFTLATNNTSSKAPPKDIFSMQATISKLTGDYTFNIATPSKAVIGSGSKQKKASVIGISSKMSSIYNTVVPSGYAFCLMDDNGDIIFHSDTARNLEENFLDEVGDSIVVRNVMRHKDYVVLNSETLYDEPVKMMIRPLDDLPYYLVTYYNKRGQNLFIFHIVAFVFVCMSILLMLVSLFSYCIMMTNKKFTKLLFVPGLLTWLKPSASKKDYYIRNCIWLTTIASFILVFSFSLSPQLKQLYVLNYAVLMPLFAVTGYYIIKRAKEIIDGNEPAPKTEKFLIRRTQVMPFLSEIKSVLLLYFISAIIFVIVQNAIFFGETGLDVFKIELRIWILLLLLPFVMYLVAGVNISYIKWAINELLAKVEREDSKRSGLGNEHYLTPFILSLLLSVSVVSVIPAVALISYALNEEKTLHFKTFQIDLARKVQERRLSLNTKYWKTKLNLKPDTAQKYIDSLKFTPSKGLYLYNNKLTNQTFDTSVSPMAAGSPFYKIITQLLFLPPDHDEFYDNKSHSPFYYWYNPFPADSLRDEEDTRGDSLLLFYKNLNDRKNASSIVLRGMLPDFFLFQNPVDNYIKILLLFGIVIFVFVFFRVINIVAKRVFLIGYFEDDIPISAAERKDAEWLKDKLKTADIYSLMKTKCFETPPASFAEIKLVENKLLNKRHDECILKIHMALTAAYERIWKDCNAVEKFTLYDFATDGFTNYKKVMVLYELHKKGLLIKEEDNFTTITRSFRNFLLTKETSEEIQAQSKQGKGSWATTRSVFYIILIVVAIFIFMSQEEASKRLITVVTSLGALLPAILKLFDKGSVSGGSGKSS